MKYLLHFLLLLPALTAWSQRENQADLVFASGKSIRSISVNVVKNFKLLSNEKLYVGVGGRAGYSWGTLTSYYTAPAKHRKSDSGIDTITVEKPMFITANLSLNACWNFNSQFSAGINLDLFGFSFGKKRDASYFPGADAQAENPPRTGLTGQRVTPMKNDFYFTGDRNKGTLYREIFVRYSPVERIGIKAGYGFLITEYASLKRIGHKDNYRFRNSQGQFLIGVGWNFI